MTRTRRSTRSPSSGDPPRVWRSYRCPVCGHTDEVPLEAPGAIRIRCSHCEARLEVTLVSTSRERVSAKVVGVEA